MSAGRGLDQVDHIVVLMLENRSFDHLLGYLTLEAGRSDIDGLQSSFSNRHAGRTYPIHHLASTRLGDGQDPCHTGACVAQQMTGDNAGFVDSYAQTHPADPDPGVVMGYHNAADLPVYDHLARSFAVCDNWYSSVPGATWPNRLYAVCGRADGSKDVRDPPVYNLPSFVRHLDEHRVSWGWYCHDIATLRLCDASFWLGHFENFAYFERRSLLQPHSFLDHAAAGTLPAVSWIDPNFVDLSFIGPSGSNDDHPPSDLKDGQELVLKLYNALATSPVWERTLLIVTYDEHGGFYDHRPPPEAVDDHPGFRRYGPRVPALVVSPLVEAGSVSNALYDHTSIIKTILTRFCRASGGGLPAMGARVAAANDLGALLTRTTPRPAPAPAEREALIAQAADRRRELFAQRMLAPAAGGAPAPEELNDLQRGVLSARALLRAGGLPEGQP